MPAATPLVAPFARPSAVGLRVAERPERLLDGGLASGTPSAKRRRRTSACGEDGRVAGQPRPVEDGIRGYPGGTKLQGDVG